MYNFYIIDIIINKCTIGGNAFPNESKVISYDPYLILPLVNKINELNPNQGIINMQGNENNIVATMIIDRATKQFEYRFINIADVQPELNEFFKNIQS